MRDAMRNHGLPLTATCLLMAAPWRACAQASPPTTTTLPSSQPVTPEPNPAAVLAPPPQDDSGTAGAKELTRGETSLEQSKDRTAPVLKLALADWYSPSVYDVHNAQSNTVTTRLYVPFRLGPVDQLARLTVPFVTSSAEHPEADPAAALTAKGGSGREHAEEPTCRLVLAGN